MRTGGSISSKAGQLEMLETLIQNQWLNPADKNHQRLVFEVLEFNNIRGNVDPTHKDRQQQRFENDLMMQGQQVEVREHDDHSIHMAEIDEYRKAHFFQGLPPEVETAFSVHWKQHELQAIQSSVRKQLLVTQVTNEMMAEQQGAPGAAPAVGGRMGILGGNGLNAA